MNQGDAAPLAASGIVPASFLSREVCVRKKNSHPIASSSPGHDADRGRQQYEHAIGLDTGCVYGGKMTACILPDRRLVSVNAKREYFQYRRKHSDLIIMLGGPAQDLSKFQMAQIPILSVLTCSTS